ncbi:MAG: hypothetical protein ACC662_03740 [Planctomycetota bacterium]
MPRPSTALVLVLLLCGACGEQSPSRGDPLDAGEALVRNGEPAVAPGTLRLELAYTSGERSKDSHAYRTKCTIEGGHVRYSGPYGECVRGQCEHKEVTFTLSPAQVEDLRDEIDRLGLFANFEETRKTGLTGHYYDLSIEVAAGERTGAIRVSGMGKAWGQDERQNISERARDWIDKVEDLRRKLLEFVRPHLPTAR